MRATAPRKRRKRRSQDPPPPPASAPPQPAKNDFSAQLPPQHRLGSLSVRGKTQSASSGVNHSMSLEGRTDYDFADATYVMPETALSLGEDCDGCEGRDCVTINAQVTITYSVTTTVTLPNASDFPELTECEARNVQNAIDTILAPHEQEHVDAVTPYNGTETVAFSGTYCRSEITDAVQEMVDAREATRQQAARDRSNALDPFVFTIDETEGCEPEDTSEAAPDTGPENSPGTGPDTAPEEEPDETPEEAPEAEKDKDEAPETQPEPAPETPPKDSAP